MKLKNSTLFPVAIIALFASLWLPLGQNEFLLDNWMKIGTFGFLFLSIGACAFCNEEINFSKNLRMMAVLMLGIYVVHQFEEHWIDLLGRHYAFYDFTNNFILQILDARDSTIKPLSKEGIFVINTSLVWLVGVIAIYKTPQQIFPLIAMASIVIVNAMTHIIAGVVRFEYNPGLFTAIFIFVPFYIFFVKNLKDSGLFYKKQIIAGIAWAVIAHIIMVAGTLMANWFNVISEMTYFAALVTWSLVPIFGDRIFVKR